MRVIGSNLDPNAIPHGLRAVSFRMTRWGLIAAKRAGPSSKPPTLLQKQYRIRWAFAGRMASAMQPLEQLTAMEMAKGTQQVWRDIATMACLGRYYYMVNPDGTTWRLLERPTLGDPYCHRPPSLTITRVIDAMNPIYLGIGSGNRLKLS